MAWELLTNKDGSYSLVIVDEPIVFFVKIPCVIALHLLLTPEISNAMRIMRFSN